MSAKTWFSKYLSDDLTAVRIIITVGSVLYLAYWYLGSHVLGLVDPLSLRLAIIILSLTTVILTFVFELFRKNLKSIMIIGSNVTFIHFLYLSIVNVFSLGVLLFLLINFSVQLLFTPFMLDDLSSFNLFSAVIVMEFISGLFWVDLPSQTKQAYLLMFGMYFLLIYMAISRNIYIQNKFHTANDRMEFVINNSPVILFVINSDSIFELSRGKGLGILGLDQNEVVGMSFYDLYRDFPKLVHRVEQAQEGQAVRDIIHLDTLTFDLSLEPHFVNGKQVGIIGTAVDITDHFNTSRKLNEIEQLILNKQKLEAVGKLASGIAHDFNNLLSIISLNNELIQYSVSEKNYEAIATQSQQIAKNVENASFLTQRLLSVSKSKMKQPKILAIDSVLAEQELILRSAVPENIEFLIEYPEDKCYTFIDEGELEQIFLNLVLNSKDAISVKQNGKICITMVPGNPESDDSHLVTITDNGKGMDEETLTMALEPFFTTKEEGSGLGLFSVKNIMEEVEGTLELSSEQGNGLSVNLWFPAIEVPEYPNEVQLNNMLQSHEEITNLRILVVEDNTSLKIMLQDVLHNIGIDVMTASDGIEALQHIDQGLTIDLLITDVLLPEIGGIELSRKCRKINPDLKTVFMSGYTEELDNSILEASHVDFLQKPFTTVQLIHCIDKLLTTS